MVFRTAIFFYWVMRLLCELEVIPSIHSYEILSSIGTHRETDPGPPQRGVNLSMGKDLWECIALAAF